MQPKPPSPQLRGSRTPCTKATVTAASIALPPAASTCAPMSAAIACGATTMPIREHPFTSRVLTEPLGTGPAGTKEPAPARHKHHLCAAAAVYDERRPL